MCFDAGQRSCKDTLPLLHRAHCSRASPARTPSSSSPSPPPRLWWWSEVVPPADPAILAASLGRDLCAPPTPPQVWSCLRLSDGDVRAWLRSDSLTTPPRVPLRADSAAAVAIASETKSEPLTRAWGPLVGS
ncbi:brain protein I3 isoform X2 [Rhinatrema bivittatum]|uniref:brain protein I3 isoform X2 n=1 Tax=Rhinatrema bivittatum TaxID=194408 RepID=UPI00112BF0AF|nr:brain protein I3 isoform X2 [Rhinatrema bivittatum]